MRISTTFVLLSLLFCISANAQKIYAVMAGIGDYPPPENKLRCPPQDARDMYGLYARYTDPGNMALLTNANATSDRILAELHKISLKAKPEDIVIFFFSGHGGDGLIATYNSYMDYSSLRSALKNIKAKRKFVFMNACFAGSLRSEQTQTALQKGYNLGGNVVLFLASRSSQFSWERSDWDNGIFTTYLLAGLRGAADANKNELITAKELFLYVYPRVKEQTKSLGVDQQIPVMWGKFKDELIILNMKNRIAN